MGHKSFGSYNLSLAGVGWDGVHFELQASQMCKPEQATRKGPVSPFSDDVGGEHTSMCRNDQEFEVKF